MTEAVVVSTARTPIGKAFRGAFNQTHGAVLAGHAIQHANGDQHATAPYANSHSNALAHTRAWRANADV